MILDDLKHVYFIGIGGIGMSALARWLHSRGIKVSGYDKTETFLTKKLVEEGMNVDYRDEIDRIPRDIDMVVYTPAIPADHAQWNYLKSSGLPFLKRSQLLGFISKQSPTIAVAGTHGKTTTSSILTHLLTDTGFGCTAFIGGIMRNYGSNYIDGTGQWIVVEADEYDRSFLQLFPKVAVITSMDPDHLDIYGSHEEMLNGFKMFSLQIQSGGTLWIHADLNDKVDDQWRSELSQKEIVLKTYGIDSGDWNANDVKVENGAFRFSVEDKEMVSRLPGRHNINNALVGLGIARELGCEWKDLQTAMDNFEGIARRFERIASSSTQVMIDDYAHHPDELKAAIAAAKELYVGKKILGVFQPHLYSRTQDFYRAFGKELSVLDSLILIPIYPAREQPIAGVNSELILENVTSHQKKCVKKEQLIEEIKSQDWDVLMILGAGDIDRMIPEIKTEIFE